MRQEVLEPGGLLLLAVPVAEDAIIWNCHRIYGRLRLTLLLRRWTVSVLTSVDGWPALDPTT